MASSKVDLGVGVNLKGTTLLLVHTHIGAHEGEVQHLDDPLEIKAYVVLIHHIPWTHLLTII